MVRAIPPREHGDMQSYNLILSSQCSGQASQAVSSWDLPSQTTLKFRGAGQNSEAELRKRDVRAQVEESERRALDEKPATISRRYGELKCYFTYVVYSYIFRTYEYLCIKYIQTVVYNCNKVVRVPPSASRFSFCTVLASTQVIQLLVLQVLASTQSFQLLILQVLASTGTQSSQPLIPQVLATIQSFQLLVLKGLASCQSFQLWLLEVLANTQSF